MYKESWEIAFQMHHHVKDTHGERNVSRRNRIRKQRKQLRLKIYMIFKICCYLFKVIIDHWLISLSTHRYSVVLNSIGGTYVVILEIFALCYHLIMTRSFFKIFLKKLHPLLIITPCYVSFQSFTKYTFQ